MLTYEIAQALFDTIQTQADRHASDEDFHEFYEDFLKSAAAYAMTRTSWSFMSRDLRSEEDMARTIQHDAFMASLNAVCRNLDIENIEDLLPDRKTKGDFACYIALFLALEQR